MRKPAAKIAISIPADLYRAVEKVRRKTDRSRSSILQEALRHWLAQQRQALLIRRYEDGYRASPESRREVQAAQATSAELLSFEEW